MIEESLSPPGQHLLNLWSCHGALQWCKCLQPSALYRVYIYYMTSPGSEEAVHTLYCFAAVVHTLRPDALATCVVKPAVF